MDSLWLDLRTVARSLFRTPLLTLAAVLSIGLAVGAATAVFSWMDGAVLHPFPAAADQGRLVGIEVGPPNGGMGAWSYQTYKELRAATRSFSGGLAAWRIIRVSAREPGETGASPILATPVSGNYFEVLGISARLGRAITQSDVDSRAPVAVLGHDYWMEHYRGASPLGRTLWLNGQAVSIVGVAPPRFSGVYTGVVPQLYVPITLQPVLSGVNSLDDRKLRSWLVFARLAPGVSRDAALSEADAAAKRITTAYGDRPAPGAVMRELRLEFLGATLSPLFSAMLGVSLLLIALASANVASLLLVRADGRRGELAVRRALGASGPRVARAALLESALLALGGGMIGVLTAYFARGLLYAFIPRGSFPISLGITLNWRVLAVALAAATVVTAICGVAPTLSGLRVPAAGALRGAGRGLTRGRNRVRFVIVTAQLSLSVLALVLAGMFVRGLSAATAIDVGFSNPERVLLVNTDFRMANLADSSGFAALELLLRRLRALPGVQSASVASMVPLGFGGRNIIEMKVAGYAPAPNENMSAELAQVGSAYAATMGIRVVRGRDLGDDDRIGRAPVALVNESFVRQFFPKLDPIGQRVAAGRGWFSVVGVLHDGKYDRLDEPAHPVVYVPMAQWLVPSMALHLRATVPPRSLVEAVRRTLWSVNADLPALQTRTLAEHISASTFVPRIGTQVIGAFAAMALFLSAVGLYAALAFVVAVRAREFAIRLALGAPRRVIARGVAISAGWVAGAGLLAGSGIALAGGALLRSQVPGVRPPDPLIAIAVVLVLFLVTLGAAWLPARSAVRVDPAIALRGE